MFKRYKYNNGRSIAIIDDQTHLPVPEIDDYLSHLKIRNSADFTVISYGSELLKWYNYCASHSIDPLRVFDDDIDTQAVFDGFIVSEKERGNLNNTVRHALVVVYEYYKYLYARKMIAAGPYQRFATVIYQHNRGFLSGLSKRSSEGLSPDAYIRKDPANPINYISWEQYKVIQQTCAHPRDRVLFGVMFEGGARIGEALGIHIGDISLEDKSIRLVYRDDNPNNAYVKRHSERTIYMSDYLCEQMYELFFSMTGLNTEFLFVEMYGKNPERPMTYDNARSIVDRISKKTGIPFHAHMFRHGYAQERFDDDASEFCLAEIGKTMGHANEESTRIYAGFSEEKMRRKAKEYLKERNTDELIDREVFGKDGK